MTRQQINALAEAVAARTNPPASPVARRESAPDPKRAPGKYTARQLWLAGLAGFFPGVSFQNGTFAAFLGAVLPVPGGAQ